MDRCGFCGLVDKLMGNKDRTPSNQVSRYFLYVGKAKSPCPVPIALCQECLEYNLEVGGINLDFDVEISEEKYKQYLLLA